MTNTEFHVLKISTQKIEKIGIFSGILNFYFAPVSIKFIHTLFVSKTFVTEVGIEL
jgi:hypothetical protein